MSAGDAGSDAAPGATTTIAAHEARRLGTEILVALGACEHEATQQVEHLLEADLRGHPSHGLRRLPVLVERIRNGVAVPGAEPVVVWHTAAFASLDARRGLGPVVAHAAIDHALERATETGIALVAVSNANHVGMLAPYVERIATNGRIGLAMTTSEALVHAFGGRRAMIGTNPLAIGLPAEPRPFVLDMATGEVAMGRILAHAERGEAIPQGWALDAAGEPTTDPLAAVAGSIAPFGGAKGYGLGLGLELLVAALSASALGTEVRGTLDVGSVCNKGDVFVVVDPEPLQLGDIATAISPYLEQVRTDGGTTTGAVAVPGDGSADRRARRLLEGVPVATSVLEALRLLERDLTGAPR